MINYKKAIVIGAGFLGSFMITYYGSQYIVKKIESKILSKAGES